MENEQNEDEREIDAFVNGKNEPGEKLIELVKEGIKETLQLFKEHPQMFSTEGDCVAHLFRIIGDKEFDGRKLTDPHHETGACAIRREWKIIDTDNRIDIVIIEPEEFKINKQSNTKKGGGFGKASGLAYVEVKGPQINKDNIETDIKEIPGNVWTVDETRQKVGKFVVVFAGQKLNGLDPWKELEEKAKKNNVKFYYEKTDIYRN